MQEVDYSEEEQSISYYIATYIYTMVIFLLYSSEYKGIIIIIWEIPVAVVMHSTCESCCFVPAVVLENLSKCVCA